MASSLAPTKPRACLLCGVVLGYRDFLTRGCPNCDHLLNLRDSHNSVMHCTSASFDSYILMLDPKDSWAARFLHMAKDIEPGMYAIKIDGMLPEEVIDQLRDNNVIWIPRDGTDLDDGLEQDNGY